MASTQQVLSALVDMQRNAQNSLPVIPNNGNPGGAYNMPRTSQPDGAAPVAPKGPDLSWLQPSQSMQNVTNMLASRRNANVVASS